MIAERTVVRMLLYGHYLYGVVAVGGNTRQNVFAELIICAYSFALLRHAYVAFVYQKRFGIGHESLHFPFVWFLRTPYLGREYVCLLILDHPVGIGRNTLAASAFPADIHFVQISVAQGCGRELYLPDAVGGRYTTQGILAHDFPF